MKNSIKSFALVTLTALSLTNGLMVGDASAETNRLRMQSVKPVQSEQTFKPSLKLKNRFSALGNWMGNIYAQGDDVLTQIELSFTSNNTGTWKHHGSQYNPQTDQWEPKVLQQGSFTSAFQGNNVNIQMNNFGNKNVMLQGNIQNNGTKIAGEVVGQSPFVFYVNKQ